MGYVKTLIKEVLEAVEQISCEPRLTICVLFCLKLADAVDLIADSTEEACDDNE